MSDAPRRPPVPGDPRARAAASLRRLGHAVMAHDAGDDLLGRIADGADDAADELEASPGRERDLLDLKRRMFDVEVPDGARVVHFDECFVSGPYNPMGIAIDVRREDEEAVADVELGAAFEGAPARSHGGIVAAVFDDVLGYLLTLRQEPAFTGELSIRYLAATPIRERLEFRARAVDREGRKLFTEGEATADGEVVARATATFVFIEPERMRS